MREAASSGLVEETGIDRWRFTHDVVRETLEIRWGVSRAALTHAAIATAMERHSPENHAAIASHWMLVGGSEAVAADHAALAGDRAMSRLAYHEAEQWFGKALELRSAADEQPDLGRCQVQIRHGLAAKAAGMAVHRQILLEAGRLAEDLGSPQLMAQAALANQSRRWSFAGLVDAERVVAVEAALAALGEVVSSERCLLMAALSAELVWTDQRERRHELARRAVDEALGIGDRATVVDTACMAHVALWEAPFLEEDRELAAVAVEAAASLGDLERLGWAHRAEYLSAQDAGDIDRARSAVTELIRISDELGQPALRWHSMMFKATLHVLGGDLRRAEALIEEARQLGLLGPGAIDGEVWYLVQMFGLRFAQTNLAELARPLGVLADAFPALQTLGAFHALALLDAGEDRRAAELLDVARTGGFAHPLDCSWLAYLASYAEVAYRLSSSDAAAGLYEILLPFQHMAVACGIIALGSVQHYLGVLAVAAGREGSARDHLRRAVEVHEAWDAPVFQERSRRALGRSCSS